MGDALEAAPGGYRLAADVDLQRFNALLEEGHAREALALWRGPSGIPALEEARLQALLALPDATLGELETAAAEHPLNEKLAARYIEALAAAGRQADALSAYERIRTRLDEELGALPSGELVAAHMSVLKAPTRRTSNLRAPVTSFVGREADLERIDSLLETAAPGHARRPGRRGQDPADRGGALALGGPRQGRRVDGRARAGDRRGRGRPRRARRARPARARADGEARQHDRPPAASSAWSTR